MNRFSVHRLFVLVAVLAMAGLGSAQQSPAGASQDTFGTLVSTEWLSQHLDDPNLIVLDCTVRMMPDPKGGMRSVSGRADYDSAHIPSAGFADLIVELSDTSSSHNFAMPTPEQFCATMGALGVGDESRVVLYDSFNSVWAARVWWMLRWAGFERAALLDGGFKAWVAEGRPTSSEPADYSAKRLTPNPRLALVAHQKEVLSAIDDKAVVLVDAMPPPHFRGEMVLYGRPGHIPGAINASAMALLDESGRYRSHDELAGMFKCDHGARIITYCGAGVAASSDAFVLHRLGFEDVAVYMASLQEWAADSTKPMVVGAE